ncbi:EAL domain-containing protein [Fontimonas sp. SYSU GA230001]|uniref:EAL domain-containing response regulator n=1 Tax=Fontimonas sp. SYSU GA230001 TaxID=3142450 RepID=UPI0032B5BFA9
MNSPAAQTLGDDPGVLPRAVLERVRQALVIDDDDFVCKVVAGQLRSLGIERVSTSSGGPDTVRLLNEGGPFDLIVSDLCMPKFDGIQLMRLVAARQSSAAVLYISSSGHKLLAAARDLAAERGLRVLPVQQKPVERERLRDALLELGREARAPAARRNGVAAEPSVAELRQAIADYEIQVFVQPQIDARSGELHGVEALARWISVQHGPVSPEYFVALAEQHDLIDELTEVVLKKSLFACAKWAGAGLDTHISVNAPVASMSNLVLPDTIVAQLERLDLRPDQLSMEITETGFLRDPQKALDVLTRLRLRGIGLAIDDFGCGHSTFQQLRRMPFNELKVDRSFVLGMFTERDARSILRSSLELARELELYAVAEGVETSAHAAALAQMGCEILQGYFLSRPFPADQLPAWWRQNGARLRALALRGWAEENG